MPKDIPVYTQCAGPGGAKSYLQIEGVAGVLVRLFLFSQIGTSATILAVLIAMIVANSPATWVVFTLILIAGLEEVKDWYYNYRLLCVRDRDCAIGTVIKAPTANFDGDIKLNLMLAPFTHCDWLSTLREHLAANSIMLTDSNNFNDPPFHTSAPPFPNVDAMTVDFGTLREYMISLKGEDPNEFPADSESTSNMYRQVLIGMMDRAMKNPFKNFYNRLMRKDPTLIDPASALWQAIPEDFDSSVNWEGQNTAQSTKIQRNDYQDRLETLNPMFRFDLDHMVPYLHGEIEGYYVKHLIDQLIVALVAFMVAVVATSFLGPISFLVGLVIAFLLQVLLSAIDDATGNDGNAGTPDVTWGDPGAQNDGVPKQKGDVVIMYGNHIMDTDHYQYFEIHPVRAYYVLYHDPTLTTGGQPTLTPEGCDETRFSNENALQGFVNKEFADDACLKITNAEEGTTVILLERKGSTMLSYGMTTRYGGGSALRPT
jgi:hypothetical protein